MDIEKKCPKHLVEWKKHEKDGNTWYSHKDGDGYCNRAQLLKDDPEIFKLAQPKEATNDKDTDIRRAVALKAAVDFLAQREAKAEHVTALAEIFEKWLGR